MITGAAPPVSGDRRRKVAVVVWVLLATLVATVVVAAYLLMVERPPIQGPTVGEKLTALQTERAALQARADGEARIDLVTPFRVASLMSDALAVRYGGDRELALAALAPPRRRIFSDVDALNAALRAAWARPGEGARLAARAAAKPVQAALDRLAGDGAPLVLQFTPRFVPPRRGAAALNLAPEPAAVPPSRIKLPAASDGMDAADQPDVPLVPRYAPDFAATASADPPVEIEITALGLDHGGAPPVLTIGDWHGPARLSPLRLHFSVPRSAFATGATRTDFVNGSLSSRRDGHIETFDLLFVVLPDEPGSFALDQRVQTTVPEANTLVSPEILARAEAGKTNVVRRCFDPPPGQHFDKSQRRVVEVERLGWLGDASDPTLNDGSVAFAPNEPPNQICIVVTARPVTREARTATIGRFEATLVRDRLDEKAVKSGVRALDWREAVRIPLEPSAVEWRLYLRLFGEINRTFDQPLNGTAPLPDGLPFLHISRDADGKNLILRADPTAAPSSP